MNINSHKIADLRTRLLNMKTSRDPLARTEFYASLDPCVGELLAMADAFAKVMSLYPDADWADPDFLTEASTPLVAARSVQAARDFLDLVAAANAREGVASASIESRTNRGERTTSNTTNEIEVEPNPSSDQTERFIDVSMLIYDLLDAASSLDVHSSTPRDRAVVCRTGPGNEETPKR
jgi:hypothetical protein